MGKLRSRNLQRERNARAAAAKKKEGAFALRRELQEISRRHRKGLTYFALKQLLETNQKKLAKDYGLDPRLRPVFFDILDKHSELVPLVDKFFERFPELADLPVHWQKK